MPPMEELEGMLQSLQSLKPPGVTKTKIDSITTICIENVQSESIIIQKIFTQFKKSPNTHKLGVLYVVDSVTRQWMEKARQAGQTLVGAASTDGTYASGIHKMTELLPVMMPELIQNAPDNQKDKIRKLIDIWERGQTFPQSALASFKQRLDSSSIQDVRSTTPSGSPPANQAATYGLAPQQLTQAPAPSSAAPAAPSDAGSLLAALASMAKQSAPAPAPAPAPNIFPAQGIVNNVGNMPYQNVAQVPVAQPVYPGSVSAPPVGGSGISSAQIPPYQSSTNNFQPAVPQVPQVIPGGNEVLMQILQAIAQQKIPQEQVAQVLTAIGLPQLVGALPIVPAAIPAAPFAVASQNGHVENNPVDMSRDQDRTYHQNGVNDYQDPRHRDRSRSPDYNRNRHASPPNRRDSPTYGAYDPNAGAEGNTQNRNPDQEKRGRGRGRGARNEYRQRSPARRQSSPPASNRPFQPKYLEFDPQLPPGHIKVLSRTLFVGGASATEAELRAIFSRFGRVQSCIANIEKRHAFVKMVDRPGAVAARLGMENIQEADILAKARQVKWGVGFGPRDCSDYNTGVSVIPIERLTEADHKWVLSAECGGTGGRPLESGMIIEEPDIEIGAGVSSKAISRRVGPEPASRRGGHFANRGGHESAGPRNRRLEKHEARQQSPRVEPNTIGVPPPVPGFGFSFPGMPMNMTH